MGTARRLPGHHSPWVARRHTAMLRVILLASSVPIVASAHYKDWEPGSCDLAGAEDYLGHFGIGPGLPKLDVRYGHFTTQELFINGAETTFAKGKEELGEPPRVKWEQTGKYTESKYMVIMVDA